MRWFRYNAWARKKGSNDEYVTTEVLAGTLKGAIKKYKELGLEIDGEPYLSYIQG